MSERIIDCRDVFLMERTLALMERAKAEMEADGSFSNKEICDRIGEIFREGLIKKRRITNE